MEKYGLYGTFKNMEPKDLPRTDAKRDTSSLPRYMNDLRRENPSLIITEGYRLREISRRALACLSRTRLVRRTLW